MKFKGPWQENRWTQKRLLESGRFKLVETTYDWTLNSRAHAERR